MKHLTLTLISILFVGFDSCTSKKTESTENTDSTAAQLPDSASLTTKSIFQTPLRLCTERLPPPPPSLVNSFSTDTVFNTVSESRKDTLIQNRIKKIDRPYISSLSGYRWPKLNLTVTFLDGDPEVIKRVTAVAKQWENYCGIRFKFGNFPNPDISISFLYLGSWSYIGTYSQKVSPSMNFGWLTRDTDQAEYSRVVLHEFGHALGFIHEHQREDTPIQWVKDSVYAYYEGPPNNWSKENVDEDIFKHYDHTQTNGTAFDPASIMIYAVPAQLTIDHKEIPWPNGLSPLDKKYVGQFYPSIGPVNASARRPSR